jgi:midasin (ATPase involved in ribosome maturation)
MTIATANLTASQQIETLAKLYIEGKPAKIPAGTITQLCDWLMSEFQQLPLDLQYSDYMRYANAEEMFVDIDQSHLWVSAESYDSAVYPNPIYGFIFQGLHDYDHYLTNSDFSLQGEIVAYNFRVKRVPNLDVQKIIYSEVVLRTAAYLQLGYAAAPKVVFP